MSVFSIFKKNTKVGTDSIIDSSEFIEGPQSTAEANNELTTKLSIAPGWKVEREQEYVLKFLSNDLQALKPNQLSLSGIDIIQDKDTGNWHVQAFIRSSLNKSITLGKTELLLLDADNNPLATQEFNLSELGSLPPLSNRPWIFIFEKQNIKTENSLPALWTLAFNVQSLVPHSLDLEETWENALLEEQKSALRNIVKGLPALKPREVNIIGFQAKITEEHDLNISVFIRNGCAHHVNLEKISLEVLDAKAEVVAQGSFKLENFMVKANTSKPWTFIFPKEMVLKENPDFTRWTARLAKYK
ncbi:MAG TPA: accessory Sec system S-layer assembly protein [Planococcus sp. (in: firmicutes)]|nr:accessory Sec system S-layer assembly protein [Planococcus sp. (in: firmicutes)]